MVFKKIIFQDRYVELETYQISILIICTPPLELFLDWQKVFCTMHIVEATMNMAEYGSQRSEQPQNVNFEPTIRGLRNDIFDWDQV